jgi:hypothetical protein
LTYGDNNDIILSGKGTGGLTEMKGQLNDNKVYFGVARVRAVDDHGSKRAKFVFITYVGAGVVSIVMFYKNISYRFLCFISLHSFVLGCQHINLNSKDFLMGIIFKIMPMRKMIYPKNR